MDKLSRHIIFTLNILIVSGCEDVFEYSPYQADVKSKDKNQTVINQQCLEAADTIESDSLVFILIADSHNDYYELEKAVEKINTFNNVEFVVHLGDITDHGWLKEYEIASDILRRLQAPLLTCIGNHDYLAAGKEIYEAMYGQKNYSLVYKEYKLVFFDATTFESNTQPDMAWLESQLTEDGLPTLLFSHIPPWDDQYKSENTSRFAEIIVQSHVVVSMFGHHHAFNAGELFNTNADFIIPGCVGNRKLCRVIVYNYNSYSMKMISF